MGLRWPDYGCHDADESREIRGSWHQLFCNGARQKSAQDYRHFCFGAWKLDSQSNKLEARGNSLPPFDTVTVVRTPTMIGHPS